MKSRRYSSMRFFKTIVSNKVGAFTKEYCISEFFSGYFYPKIFTKNLAKNVIIYQYI